MTAHGLLFLLNPNRRFCRYDFKYHAAENIRLRSRLVDSSGIACFGTGQRRRPGLPANASRERRCQVALEIMFREAVMLKKEPIFIHGN